MEGLRGRLALLGVLLCKLMGLLLTRILHRIALLSRLNALHGRTIPGRLGAKRLCQGTTVMVVKLWCILAKIWLIWWSGGAGSAGGGQTG